MTRFAHALFGILPAWRRLCDGGVPLWRFARRRRLGRVEALRADLRCRRCDALALCRRRGARPVAGCPNAGVFGPP